MTSRPFSVTSLRRLAPKPLSSFIFFYSASSSSPYACFSNFYRCPKPFVCSSGIEFPTSEHYLMYQKAILFQDIEIAQKILDARNPRVVKALGRKVSNFDQKVWNNHCLQIMVDGCVLKFSQCLKEKKLLLDTSDKILVEAASRDTNWGIGMGKTNRDRGIPAKWRGRNLLGEALMETRKKLREAEAEAEDEAEDEDEDEEEEEKDTE